jgi:S1-C subfamily serine protease
VRYPGRPAAVLATLISALVWWCPRPCVSAERLVPETRQEIQLSFAPVVRATAPAVVNIYSRRVVQARASPLFDDPFFRRFFGEGSPLGIPRKRIENSLGSGVIVAPEGVIVTNRHLVAGADEVTVVLADRREFEARILGSDERTDVAVLKVDTGGENLPYLAFRDSDTVEVGDLVLAIGNPFGVGQTVTSGIVSAAAQTRVGITDLIFFIQTDAAINPGNSGGALVDLEGRLIGINTAIYSQSGGSIGIGFAIPANMVRSVVAGLTSVGHLQRPWLGATGREVTSDVALDVNGRPVDDAQALDYRIATLPVGGSADVTIWRKGEERTVTLPIRTAPEDPPRSTVELTGSQPLAGATVANLSPAVAEELGLERFYSGVAVVAVRPRSPAQQIGLHAGDRILSVNGQEVSSTSGLRRQMSRRSAQWQIVIGRRDQQFSFIVGG